MTKKPNDKLVTCEAQTSQMCWRDCPHRTAHSAGSIGMKEPCRDRYCEYLMREVKCVEVGA